MPRTIRNEFDKKLTYDNLMKAHQLSKKGKGYRKEIILFNLKQEEYITWLFEQLKNGTYEHGGYTTFYVTEPKLRRIEKSRYLDRIVHRWIVDNFLSEYYIKTFIHTTYACIKTRGMHKACLDLQNAMIHCKKTWNHYYILKMDIKKYFDNIDKDILYNILKRKISDKKLLWLLQKIIYSNCTREEKDNPLLKRKGLPIGNYTSQTFANIYLNELDQYVKHNLKVKYYFRYLDDIILFVKTKQEAKENLEKIKKFLKENLELELNKKTQIFKSKQGVNFCGYKINEYRLKIRDKGKRKLKKKVKVLTTKVKEGKITSKEAKFIINSNNISIAMFEIITIQDKQIIRVKAYNEIADYIYQLKTVNARFSRMYIKCIEVHFMLITYCLLALSTSIDSIGIGIAYGVRNIKISKEATIILFFISFIISGFAIFAGKMLHQILPIFITNWIGNLILIVMGIILLFQSVREPASYDTDDSKQIDSKEAISLGIALSLDSFSVGIGTGVIGGSIIWIFPLFVALFQILFLNIGSFLGIKLKRVSNIPSSFWNILAAILLILIGIVTL